MTDLLTKGGRTRTTAVAVALILAVATGALAQKRKSPGTDICVAKNMTLFEDAQYTSIQAAVNAAKTNDVIEILDTEIYDEQVTIDGRPTSPWSGVTGNKNGITIRYVVDANAPWNHPRPTIRYRDVTDVHPKNETEAKKESEIDGAGNFETNGALRILRAKGVTIQGIAVDGGGKNNEGPFAFGANNVWRDEACNKSNPLFHGNAAITLAVAGQVTIRDCDLKNAYFGINVKDRNTGGVFGNPNRSDNDVTVPLSGFGKVGGHLFEYNKINNNVVGIFFESAWDLGSTVRYNLIYGNKVNKSLLTGLPDPDLQNGGAFMFKDMYLSPVAIYNNTLYDNTGNFCGNWQAGGQHLIFNNIFSKSSPTQNPGNSHMTLDGAFPNRMHFNVFSVDPSLLQTQHQDQYDCATNSAYAPGGTWVTDIQKAQGTGFGAVTGTDVMFTACRADSNKQNQKVVRPGALFPSVSANNTSVLIPAASENRWLQTEGSGSQLPMLFKSVTSTSADFLVPNWDNELVKTFIKNKGWPTAGIRNNDGSLADIGAIPSTATRQTTVARIIPTNVVILSGNPVNGQANFNLKVDNNASFPGLGVKMLRWIAPIPDNKKIGCGDDGGDWPSRMKIVDIGSIHNIANPTLTGLKVGTNTGSFRAEGAVTGTNATPYGFFEMIIESTDGQSKKTTSDVGFLPYRKLEYFLDITVKNSAGTVVTTVTAGESYTITVERRCPANATGDACPSKVDEVEYSLLSDPSAVMKFQDGTTLSLKKNETFPATYSNVFFSRAGSETIFGSAVALKGGNRTTDIVFVGTANITVNPGAPEKIVFQDPISLKQLGTAPATIINRGARYPVKVQVKDRFDNPIKSAVPVKLEIIPAVGVGVSNDCQTCAQILSAATVNTDTTGTATFTVQTTGAAQTGKTFDMKATTTQAGVKEPTDNENIGRLRVGKPIDALQVFYSDNGTGKDWETYYKADAKIDATVGEWVEVTVKVVVGDTVKYNHSDKIYVMVVPDGDFVFSADKSGTPLSDDNVFELKNGTVTFYISTKEVGPNDVTGRIDVYAWDKASGSADYSINAGGRGNITFHGISSDILYAVVYGNGEGQPDSVLVMYDASTNLAGSNKPSEVKLNWGKAGVDQPLIATGAAVTVQGTNVLKAVFTGAARPKGYTRIDGAGRGLVEVTGGAGGATSVENKFVVYDGIGPVMAVWDDDKDGAGVVGPKVYSNDAGNAVDTLDMPVSEPLKGNGAGLTKVMYKASASGTPVALTVVGITGTNPYKVVVSAAGGVHPEEGGWIRFDPADGVSDDVAGSATGPGVGKISDNGPHADNRWAQLRLKELDPDVKSAWFVGDDETGKPKSIFIEYERKVELNKWFVGGSVKIAGSSVVSSAEVSISDATRASEIFGVSGNTLEIKLAEFTKGSTCETCVFTGPGDLTVTFDYSKGMDWSKLVQPAADRAAPVIAKAVLKTGSVMKNGTDFYLDTLVVYYSENLSGASQNLTGNSSPVTLKLKSGEVTPELTLLDNVKAFDGWYMAKYAVPVGALNSSIETGDSVHINPAAGIVDNVNAANVQKDPKNRWVAIKVESNETWTVKVKNNPFISGENTMGVVISPNRKGEVLKTFTALIKVFDNVGSLVLETKAESADGEKIEWVWDGVNGKGRSVGSGTYLFKAKCNIETAAGEKKAKAVETKTLGVIRGKGK